MPTVFIKDGFRFFFYSNEHLPVHVHVRKDEGEAIFEIEGETALRQSIGLKTKELTAAEALVEEYKKLIIQKWHEFFD